METNGGSQGRPCTAAPPAPLAAFPGCRQPAVTPPPRDTGGLVSGAAKWPRTEMLTRSVIRGLFARKTEGWQPAGTAAEAHSGDGHAGSFQ